MRHIFSLPNFAHVKNCLFAVSIFIVLADGLCQAQQTYSADKPVYKILQEEANGIAVDRSKLSDSVKDLDRWHSGYIKTNMAWSSIEDLDSRGMDQKLQQYLMLREKSSADKESHREVGLWCKKNSLPMQARAHWHAILDQDRDDAQARKELRHEQFDGRWYSFEDLADYRMQFEDRLQNLREWTPITEKICTGIQSNIAAKKSAALKQLREIDSPKAIIALQMAASSLDDDLALPFVSAIMQFHCRDACQELTVIALQDPSSKRCIAALSGLQQYDEHWFVPQLLTMLRTPLESELSGQFTSDGRIVFQRVFTQETADEKYEYTQLREWVTGQAQYKLRANFGIREKDFRGIRLRAVNFVKGDQSQLEKVVSDAAVEQQRVESVTKLSQTDVARCQSSCRSLLSRIAKLELGDSPLEYWKWWDQFNERSRSGQVPTRSASDYNTYRSFLPTQIYGVEYSRSCLTKGTPIQTFEGLRPIDSIRVGDLVVAQNIETGELGFKPVIRTTLRPPATTVAILTDAGEIQATLGHYWWVAGKGWVRTRDLKPDMRLHNATATSKILSVKPMPEQVETYNLVVDDFHTYFVGSSRILSFDATELRPTFQVVPGLPVKLIAAK